MNNKKLIKTTYKAFTLIELMVATVISVILWTSVFSVITNIQLQQKKIVIAQSFYNESTILKDRIVQLVRNNTIDYDRHWEEEMRDSSSGNWETECWDNYSGKIFNNILLDSKDKMTYSMSFYRDSTDNEIDKLDRNFAGWYNDNPDNCTYALPLDRSDAPFIYLINASRNIRQSIRYVYNPLTSKGILEVEVLLGADSDNDGIADTWGVGSWDGSLCLIGTDYALGIDSEEICNRSHLSKSITPPGVNIKVMNFNIEPRQDPYLAWRSDLAQVHPHAHLFFAVEYQGSGFESDEFPMLNLLTSASSRVYGDTRK